SRLNGYIIPGIEDKLVATLFADDTAVYLKQGDKYKDLLEILDAWCLASGAKFNINKTEVIPIGSLEFRNEVRRTRRFTDGDEPFGQSVKIKEEGECCRYLGAYIGNKIDNEAVWEKIIESIRNSLQQWAKCGPKIDGKRLIISMIVAGKTQYLTRVQGMPTEVLTRLQNLIRNFIWQGDVYPPMALNRLY
ncbi:hypothetical protein SISSUDRAFT_959521, partial [Sistotremastrum suecicum HHB10207 ss-3]